MKGWEKGSGFFFVVDGDSVKGWERFQVFFHVFHVFFEGMGTFQVGVSGQM